MENLTRVIVPNKEDTVLSYWYEKHGIQQLNAILSNLIGSDMLIPLDNVININDLQKDVQKHIVDLLVQDGCWIVETPDPSNGTIFYQIHIQ